MKERVSKVNYYLHIADTVLERGTCLRRNYGAVLVKDDQIIATGYNGAPRGMKNCSDTGYCERVAQNVPQGERYELCCAVHAEANAIISASRSDMIGATLYLSGRDANTGDMITAEPCRLCQKLIMNAGIKEVICRDEGANAFHLLVPESFLK